MPVVLLAEPSEPSLFAKEDFTGAQIEKDLYFLNIIALLYTCRNVFFVWCVFWKQEFYNAWSNKMAPC